MNKNTPWIDVDSMSESERDEYDSLKINKITSGTYKDTVLKHRAKAEQAYEDYRLSVADNSDLSVVDAIQVLDSFSSRVIDLRNRFVAFNLSVKSLDDSRKRLLLMDTPLSRS